MKTLGIALLSISFSVTAQFFLKAGMSGATVRQSMGAPFSVRTIFSVLSDVKILTGFLLYGVGAFIWLAVLSKWDVSKAYPLVGLGFVFSLAIGLLLGEQITPLRFGGVALICLGVLAIAQS